MAGAGPGRRSRWSPIKEKKRGHPGRGASPCKGMEAGKGKEGLPGLSLAWTCERKMGNTEQRNVNQIHVL